MRRRIYIDPEGTWSDVTDRPYHFEQAPDETLDICRVGTLYDDTIWQRYQEAIMQLRKAQADLSQALIYEPFDKEELSLGERWRQALDSNPIDRGLLDELTQAARDYAKQFAKPNK